MIGLVFGWVLLFVTKPAEAFAGICTILGGGFTDGVRGVGILLFTATPIILTGLSVGFSIRTGLFNIGAAGQFTVGAFAAIWTGVYLEGLPPLLHCALAILAGTLAGGLWGLISGLLKGKGNVSEVISGILLNYIGMLLVNLLIRNTTFDSAQNCSVNLPRSAMLTRDFFESILPNCRINPGFLIVIAAVVVIWALLERTTFGYELKMTGKNRFVGSYSGIKASRNIALTMAISGALAGLGGALMYLSDFNNHIIVAETVLPYGFTGISVALLGMSDPFGILAAGLFIAHITIGGNYLQLYSYTPDAVDMIIAVIVYCGALTLPIRTLLEKLNRQKTRLAAADAEEAKA